MPRRRRARRTPQESRKTRAYQRARKEFLATRKNALCVECKRIGITEPATQLDHIIPIKDAPDRFWDPTNWQGLCDVHHEAKTARENAGESLERAAWRERIQEIYGVGPAPERRDPQRPHPF